MNQRLFFRNNFFQENLLIRYQRKRVASAILCGTSGLGEAQQVFLKSDLKNLIQKIASWYQLALLATIANAKIS